MKRNKKGNYGLTASDEHVGISHGMSVHLQAPPSTFFGRRGDRSGSCMLGKGFQLQELGRALLSGASIHEAARRIGCSRNTARKLYRILVAAGASRGVAIRCECGQPSTHQGWCKARYSKSASRQSTLRALHEKQRDWRTKVYPMCHLAAAARDER